MSEREDLDKEEAVKRLSDPEGDQELHASLERMRVHHPHLWEVLPRCTSPMMPTPRRSRSGEGRLRVARRTSGPSTMTKLWPSCRWGSSSFSLVQ